MMKGEEEEEEDAEEEEEGEEGGGRGGRKRGGSIQSHKKVLFSLEKKEIDQEFSPSEWERMQPWQTFEPRGHRHGRSEEIEG